MMDELSDVFDEVIYGVKRQKNRKGKSCPTRDQLSTPVKERRQSTHTSLWSADSVDDGIGLSSDSADQSIAQSVKRRKRLTNCKQFDSKLFYDSVVDQIENRYKNSAKEDAIIDLHNLEVIDKKGFVAQRVRTEFGYFAENTLEDLRLNSFRNKDLISCPLLASTPNTSKQKIAAKPTVPSKQTIAVKPTVPSKQTNSRVPKGKAVKGNNLKQKSKQTNAKTNSSGKQLVRSHRTVALKTTNVMIGSDEESDEDSDESNESEEWDENNPLVAFDNRNVWNDSVYQLECLNKTLDMLRKDRSLHFSHGLKQRAMQTLNVPALPSGPNIVPIVKYNSRGEPNFEFYFFSLQSPLETREELPMASMADQIISLSKLIYECILYNDKRIAQKKREIDFIY